jgi:enamine deaminase RidA (YjgF/YER057c/UK114 family)
MTVIEEKLGSLGIKLSDSLTPRPAGSYVPIVVSNSLAFVSGQVPLEGGGSASVQAKYKGKVGTDISVEDGQKAARLCLINALSQLKIALGSLDNIKKFVKISGYVNCDPSFIEQPKVINGASDLMLEVFGEKGKHARTSVGVISLPFDSAVEIDFIVEI